MASARPARSRRQKDGKARLSTRSTAASSEGPARRMGTSEGASGSRRRSWASRWRRSLISNPAARKPPDSAGERAPVTTRWYPFRASTARQRWTNAADGTGASGTGARKATSLVPRHGPALARSGPHEITSVRGKPTVGPEPTVGPLRTAETLNGPSRGADHNGVLDLDDLLRFTMEQRGSDLHLKVGSTPFVRVDGRLTAAPLDRKSVV